MAKKAAKKTAPKKAAAGKTRRGWSADDLKELKMFAVQRRTDRAKAPWKGAKGITTKLKRTEGAIRQKAHAEGIALS